MTPAERKARAELIRPAEPRPVVVDPAWFAALVADMAPARRWGWSG